MKVSHDTAKTSYYNTRASKYDEFNENNSRAINTLLEKLLREYGVSNVLDLTCGTGSQVFWLSKAGFKVVGCDISRSMLKIAKQKAKLKGLKIKFLQGDCRNINADSFDAVITIFNSIGHLTRADFELTIQNINLNLNPNGLYIFDIFNLDYFKSGNNITKLTGDWMIASGNSLVREIQFSIVTNDGILASYSTYVHQDYNSNYTKVYKGYFNTLQVYNSCELYEILKKNGFIVLAQTNTNGKNFSKENSERILTIAKKI